MHTNRGRGENREGVTERGLEKGTESEKQGAAKAKRPKPEMKDG